MSYQNHWTGVYIAKTFDDEPITKIIDVTNTDVARTIGEALAGTSCDEAELRELQRLVQLYVALPKNSDSRPTGEITRNDVDWLVSQAHSRLGAARSKSVLKNPKW